MLSATVREHINGVLASHLRRVASSGVFTGVGGGSINQTYQIQVDKHTRFFCKINSSNTFPLLFEKEKNGLQYLAKQKVIRIPAVVSCFALEGQQVLLLEWIEQGMKNQSFWKSFGEQLAQLHSVGSNSFGFIEDNYMGALPQYNEYFETWTDFFIHQRLEPQIKMAVDHLLLSKQHVSQFERLYEALPGIFPHQQPALLHGDLWSGNFLCDNNNQPVLIDPAVYFGHRSVDLAMTTLFGGFDPVFYDAYQYHHPFESDFERQWEISNLYPLLIHLNLFGRGYLQSILHTIRRY